MSIVSEIERIKSNIENAYTACEEKGATLPNVLNSANLMECIESITGGGTNKVLGYYGAADTLYSARRYIAAASIGDYALFGGGVYGDSSSDGGSTVVDTYTSDLVKGNATALTHGKRQLKAISNNKYALFGGGMTTGDYSTLKDSVDAYDEDLVKTTTTLSNARCYWAEAVARVGEYAIFGGGSVGSGKITTNKDAYNKDLVLTTLTGDDVSYECGGASISGYAVFPMWNNSTGVIGETITYDENLVKRTTSALSVGRTRMLCSNTYNYAIFAGGFVNSSVKATADAYNKNLVRETAPNLSVARFNGGSTSLKGLAIMAGGATSNSTESSNNGNVDVYNDNLVRVRAVGLTDGKRFLAGATTGNYALFGGGQIGAAVSQKTVDVYALV